MMDDEEDFVSLPPKFDNNNRIAEVGTSATFHLKTTYGGVERNIIETKLKNLDEKLKSLKTYTKEGRSFLKSYVDDKFSALFAKLDELESKITESKVFEIDHDAPNECGFGGDNDADEGYNGNYMSPKYNVGDGDDCDRSDRFINDLNEQKGREDLGEENKMKGVHDEDVLEETTSSSFLNDIDLSQLDRTIEAAIKLNKQIGSSSHEQAMTITMNMWIRGVKEMKL
ncbi:hypothetical protein DITRI_Ditri01bG0059100 [Diplodiscus trichospermus]